MSADLEEDDGVFFGGGKSKAARPTEPEPEPEMDGLEELPPLEEEYEAELDIEDQITRTRHEKMRAAEYHDVTKLRERAAKHSASAAKFFKKYRVEEAAMVKYQQVAVKARRKAEGYMEKSKDAMAKADDKHAELEFLEGRKEERARVKIAKRKAKSAKCMSKASSHQAKAAKATQKAAAKRQRAKAFLEKSKLDEAEAQNYNKRADNLEKAQGDSK